MRKDAYESETSNASLGAIPNGPAKTAGIAVGEAAALAMIANRENDGSAPLPPYIPSPAAPGEWHLTPGCTSGLFPQWPTLKPFGIQAPADFVPAPPPALGSNLYLKDYREVKRVGAAGSTERPADRADVARFYATLSPSQALNMAARQLSTARGDSLSKNAWALAILNMTINDALIVSFKTKYHYNLWRPVTAIQLGDTDGDAKTAPDPAFAPFITTPCFPSYPSRPPATLCDQRRHRASLRTAIVSSTASCERARRRWTPMLLPLSRSVFVCTGLRREHHSVDPRLPDQSLLKVLISRLTGRGCTHSDRLHPPSALGGRCRRSC